MRVTARLDDESEQYLEIIQKAKGFKTVTDVLKYSLQEVASHLGQQGKPGDKMKALLESDFIGCAEGPEDLSVNYKEYIYQGLKDKYDID